MGNPIKLFWMPTGTHHKDAARGFQTSGRQLLVKRRASGVDAALTIDLCRHRIEKRETDEIDRHHDGFHKNDRPDDIADRDIIANVFTLARIFVEEAVRRIGLAADVLWSPAGAECEQACDGDD